MQINKLVELINENLLKNPSAEPNEVIELLNLDVFNTKLRLYQAGFIYDDISRRYLEVKF